MCYSRSTAGLSGRVDLQCGAALALASSSTILSSVAIGADRVFSGTIDGTGRPLHGPAPLLWSRPGIRPGRTTDHLRARLGVLAGSTTNDASRATLRRRAGAAGGGGGGGRAACSGPTQAMAAAAHPPEDACQPGNRPVYAATTALQYAAPARQLLQALRVSTRHPCGLPQSLRRRDRASAAAARTRAGGAAHHCGAKPPSISGQRLSPPSTAEAASST